MTGAKAGIAANTGGASFGVFQCLPDQGVSEVLAASGLDWVLVDMEHGAIGIEKAADMLAAIGRSGCVPIARVPSNDRATIKRVLDAGALGLMVPMVNAPEEAAEAVASCKYPPAGARGVGPGRASVFGVRMSDYLSRADGEVSVIVQAEHADAIRRIDEIAAVPGVDVVFVGPYDLSYSMGLPGKTDHPEVEAALVRVLAACEKAGKAAGVFCMDEAAAARRARQGFRFVALGLDSVYLHRAVKAAADAARPASKPAMGA